LTFQAPGCIIIVLTKQEVQNEVRESVRETGKVPAFKKLGCTSYCQGLKGGK